MRWVVCGAAARAVIRRLLGFSTNGVGLRIESSSMHGPQATSEGLSYLKVLRRVCPAPVILPRAAANTRAPNKRRDRTRALTISAAQRKRHTHHKHSSSAMLARRAQQVRRESQALRARCWVASAAPVCLESAKRPAPRRLEHSWVSPVLKFALWVLSRPPSPRGRCALPSPSHTPAGNPVERPAVARVDAQRARVPTPPREHPSTTAHAGGVRTGRKTNLHEGGGRRAARN